MDFDGAQDYITDFELVNYQLLWFVYFSIFIFGVWGVFKFKKLIGDYYEDEDGNV